MTPRWVGALCFSRGKQLFNVAEKMLALIMHFSAGLKRPGLKRLRENSRIWEALGAHRRSLGYPRFPGESCGFATAKAVKQEIRVRSG
jgi:hypothetical protein